MVRDVAGREWRDDDPQGEVADDRREADAIYASYVANVTRFVRWLVDNGRKVRLLIGDANGSDDGTAQEVLAGGPPRLLTYGITDDMALEIGLPCGGEIDVFVEPLQ